MSKNPVNLLRDKELRANAAKVISQRKEFTPIILLDKKSYQPGEQMLVTLGEAGYANHTIHVYKSGAPYTEPDHIWGSDVPTNNPFAIDAPVLEGVYQVRLHSVRYGVAESNLAAETTFLVKTVSPVQRPEPETPLYRTVAFSLDCTAKPYPFLLRPKEAHSYFYEAAGIGGYSGAAAYERVSIDYPKGSRNARNHAYLRNKSKPWEFYYLPDKFKLARRDYAPYLPRMAVRVSAPDGIVENAVMTMEFEARPWVDSARLTAAAAELRRMIAGDTGGREPDLKPLHATALLDMRVSNGLAAGEKNVEIDLANGFIHSLTAPLEKFRELYAAAFSRNANSNLTGRVLVETGVSAPESVPVEIRFADTQGEILSFEQASDAGGDIAVRMRNDIESDIRLRALTVRLRRGDPNAKADESNGAAADVAADIEGISLPLELEAGGEVLFTVKPREPLADDGTYDIIVDASAADVLPDPDILHPLVCDMSVPAYYTRQIDVETMPELLGAAGDPNSIMAIYVEIKGGGSLKLSRDKLQGAVDVRQSLLDLMLDRDGQRKYAFRQQIIRFGGIQPMGGWHESDIDYLPLPVAE